MRSQLVAIGAAVGLVLASVGMIGAAAAMPDYQTDYSGDADVLVSNETQTTDDLDSVYSDVTTVTDINGDGTTTTSTDVDFYVIGINESDPATSNQTELVNETRTINQDSLESFTFEPTEAQKSDYSSFYLHVEMSATGTSDHILTVDQGSLYTTSGALGGGGMLDGGFAGMSTGMIAAIVGVLGFFYIKD